MLTTTAPQNQNLPATLDDCAWGTENLDAKDVLIPKLHLMQGLSDLVAQRKAQMGDMVNSTTGEKIGDNSKPIEMIPIMSFNTWVKYEQQGKKLNFAGIEPVTPQNRNRQYEEKLPNGQVFRYDYVINFYVLLASEAKSPDALPYLISFKRTSLKAGQKLITHFMKCRALKVPGASTVFNLACTMRQNDSGTFYVFDVAGLRGSTKEEILAAKEWYQRITKGNIRVDDSDVLKDVDSTQTESDSF